MVRADSRAMTWEYLLELSLVEGRSCLLLRDLVAREMKDPSFV